ncbi:sigma-70 family RNA polymerase sigma factor [Fictibacillus sp. 7GRE50]|uniref:sigma-70 family RNA polymerase sigma factor n=1 Tax=Fictibacillus sp. 7GRE50 TaxID=2745878 RepID=UPI0018CEE936|nr:sigma-70 family RNA polymerase sigma factor [Fictibacillus sp. 7GRE50]MBH0164911.1 sigma-70 family RNA polymerase sigma factor [Fictibacillus sp. 7GRE50]
MKQKPLQNQIYDYREEELQRIIKQYGESILRLCYSYTKDQAKSEDILQDTMLTVYLQMDDLREKQAIKSWIYRIAINKCKDYLKSWHYKQLKLSHILSFTASNEKSIELKLIIQDESEQLVQEIMKLKPKYREVILLFYYEELTLQEIEQVLKLKSTTVKSRLYQARQLLKSRLEKWGESTFGR